MKFFTGAHHLFLILLLNLWFANSTALAQSVSSNKIKRTISKLKSLDEELDDPKPGEWLSIHKEKGQTFAQYVRIRPNVLTRQRHTLYIQPIGEFNETEQKIVDSTVKYLAAYFNCKVKVLETIEASEIPASAKREFPEAGDEQWLTSHILEKMLAPRLPADAFATLALTNRDLWPGEGWNFVFGYAAFRDRVGVWSLHRYGDPSASKSDYQKCLWRTIKLATHETGHMFSMQHCNRACCNMQGSNSLLESDKQPLHLCSQCQAKTAYATGIEPLERFKRLKELCVEHGFEDAAKFYEKAIEKLERKK